MPAVCADGISAKWRKTIYDMVTDMSGKPFDLILLKRLVSLARDGLIADKQCIRIVNKFLNYALSYYRGKMEAGAIVNVLAMESHIQAAEIKERIVDIAKLECPVDIARELARRYDYDPLIGGIWLQSGNSFLRWNIVTFSDENLFKIWAECFDEIVSPRKTPPMDLPDEFLKQEFPRYPLNILADRLEDMGYGDTHQELLDHLRKPKTHGPYCWAIEKMFGRIA